MTDNDIICAMLRYSKTNILKVDGELISIGDILDLINRKNAEIERLTLEYAGFQAGVKQFESEFIMPARGGGKTHFVKMKIDTIKVEAVSEFVKELHKRFLFCGMHSNGEINEIIKDVLKDFLKEKVGEG